MRTTSWDPTSVLVAPEKLEVEDQILGEVAKEIDDLGKDKLVQEIQVRDE